MKKITLILTLLLTQQLFALVSIVPIEIGVEPGYSGAISTSLETKRGNTHKDNYKLGARVNYDNNDDFVTWAEIEGEYGESNSLRDTNKYYLHLRHIHALSKESVRAEFFAQAQDNEFKLLDSRLLAGAGFRFRIFEIFDNGKGYLGVGALYENIRYTSNDPQEYNIRFNSYFAYTVTLGDDSELTYGFFYQPKVDYLNDYVSSQKLELTLHIYKQLFLNFQLAYDVDSRPPLGVEDYDFTQTTSFVFNF